MTTAAVRVLLLGTGLAGIGERLSRLGTIEVVGNVDPGSQAVARIISVDPQVICCEPHLPGIGGLELTRRVMAECPRPILVLTRETDDPEVFAMLRAGALDVVRKPVSLVASEAFVAELASKVRVASGVHVVRRRLLARPLLGARLEGSSQLVFAIGASTGGPQALGALLEALPAGFPAPVLCVQHIGDSFVEGLAGWLDGLCALQVGVACEGLRPAPGCVYLAPGGGHLELDGRGHLLLAPGPAVGGHRPSATVLLRSVARYARRSGVGILLSGMGEDGVDGLAEIQRAGGVTMCQDERSCAVFGMPGAARRRGVADHILSPGGIAAKMIDLIQERNR